MTTFIFPGQGSQKKGMGEQLFHRFPQYTKDADALLGYSLFELCIHDRDHRLQQTLYTQPALFVVNTLYYLDAMEKNSVKPSYLAGHSLGEYNALFAAGVFTFMEGLTIVKRRAELMNQVNNGSMLAVLGMTKEPLQQFLTEQGLVNIDVANYNADEQIILSGKTADIDKARLQLKKLGITALPLKVSGPFHSRYMQSVQDSFKAFLQSFNFKPPQIPVIANYNGAPYGKDSVGIIDSLTQQLVQPVQWVKTIHYLRSQAQENFVELGPGSVLTKLLAKIAFVPQVPQKNITSLTPSSSTMTIGKGFCERYGLYFPYVTGSMYKGIASPELVVKIGLSGLLGFLGTGGLSLQHIEESIDKIQQSLSVNHSYGVNLLCTIDNPDYEMQQVALFLSKGIHIMEASAFILVTPALVWFRLAGICKEATKDNVTSHHKIIAKVSRPEVASLFLSPPPLEIVESLLKAGKITEQQAELSQYLSVASDLCIESDSGGHTDQGVSFVLLPTLIRLKNEYQQRYGYKDPIYVGCAGGIGTPEAAASALILGADFIVTGSINQCTVEAATSDAVKDLLQTINIQDTTYAPAGDMFEIGAKIQVVRKGLLFPARANKLYDLYQHHDELNSIDKKTLNIIENKYFKRSFDAVWEETYDYYRKHQPDVLNKAEAQPKLKMALLFKWYFVHTSRLARHGESPKVDYQIHCGPALGAFNQWVKDTALEDWHNRHVDTIAHKLIEATLLLLNDRFNGLKKEISLACGGVVEKIEQL